MAGKRKRKCRIAYPTTEVFKQAVSMLSERYPEDSIGWKGGGLEQVEQAVAMARWAFQSTQGQPCYTRKLGGCRNTILRNNNDPSTYGRE